MEITWLGHGTFQFVVSGGETIVLDPWTDGNPAYPKGFEIKRCDTMLISHGHFDHIHDAIPLAARFQPKVIGIFETCHWLERKGVVNCAGMNKGGTQKAGSVSVTMTHAVHSCGITEDDGSIVYGGEAAGYVLTFEDGRVVYFAGDTTVFSDMALIAELYQPQTGIFAHRRFFHDEPERSSGRVQAFGCEEGDPDAFRHFPGADRKAESASGACDGSHSTGTDAG